MGNPEPSQQTVGRCNDYPVEEYTQVGGSAKHLNWRQKGDDIVWSLGKPKAALSCGERLTTSPEQNDMTILS